MFCRYLKRADNHTKETNKQLSLQAIGRTRGRAAAPPTEVLKKQATSSAILTESLIIEDRFVTSLPVSGLSAGALRRSGFPAPRRVMRNQSQVGLNETHFPLNSLLRSYLRLRIQAPCRINRSERRYRPHWLDETASRRLHSRCAFMRMRGVLCPMSTCIPRKTSFRYAQCRKL
ncbi:hypothetical protein HN011_002403 [Eciton burchellii]|nr:hypothetical protein HN011_002403 [Eciton burchellii]